MQPAEVADDGGRDEVLWTAQCVYFDTAQLFGGRWPIERCGFKGTFEITTTSIRALPSRRAHRWGGARGLDIELAAITHVAASSPFRGSPTYGWARSRIQLVTPHGTHVLMMRRVRAEDAATRISALMQ